MGLEPFTNYTCEVTANTSAGGGNSWNADTERTNEDGKVFLNENVERNLLRYGDRSLNIFLFVVVLMKS